MDIYHALIKTHHIVARGKVSKVKKLAHENKAYVIIKNGSPGLMYAEGREEEAVKEWVQEVKDLKYKDLHVLKSPALVSDTTTANGEQRKVADNAWAPGFDEVDNMSDFGKEIEKRGVQQWWRSAMGWKTS